MSDRRAALQVIVASLFGGVQAAACAADRGARHLVGLLDTGERLEWWRRFAIGSANWATSTDAT
jgi:hypothetical protein